MKINSYSSQIHFGSLSLFFSQLSQVFPHLNFPQILPNEFHFYSAFKNSDTKSICIINILLKKMYFGSLWMAIHFPRSLGGIFLHLDCNIDQIKSMCEYTTTAVQIIITTITIIKPFTIHYTWVKIFLGKATLFLRHINRLKI